MAAKSAGAIEQLPLHPPKVRPETRSDTDHATGSAAQPLRDRSPSRSCIVRCGSERLAPEHRRSKMGMGIEMTDLKGRIAVVTGASRGIGKGIALALGERGCIVYVTGRTTGAGERTIDTTAREVTELGGEGRAIQCDHGDDEQIVTLFERIRLRLADRPITSARLTEQEKRA